MSKPPEREPANDNAVCLKELARRVLERNKLRTGYVRFKLPEHMP